MKNVIIYISLISLLTFANALPHFTYDGLESMHESLGESNKITFIIYGSLSEEINPEKMHVQNYLIEDMGEFQCSLLNNEESDNEKRTHKIVCSIIGNFERKGYILDEPKVYGFDFNNEKGKTTWPKQAEKKTFLIGEIGEKIEIDTEPILLGNLGEYVNPINNVNKAKVDNALDSLPERVEVSLDDMISSMNLAKNNYGLNQAESAYMIYKWDAQNIEYDCYNYNHDRSKIDYTLVGTYNKGVGVCDGYAKIYLNMATGIGLEAERVVGYSKGASYIQGQMPSSTDHAWNAVKIDGKYYLLDVTWGAGSCKGDTFQPNFRDSYFCTNPDVFIRSHLPADPKWQLVDKHITLEEFVNKLQISMDFYDFGFKTISPDKATFTTNGQFKIDFTYGSDTEKTFLTHLYFLDTSANVYKEQANACWTDKESTSAVMTCFANNKGQYKLQIFGGPVGRETYPLLVDYIIYCNKTATTPKGFPTSFSTSDVRITEPLYNPLTRGRMLKFTLKSKYSNLYITNKATNNNHFRELDNKGNGLFEGEDVYIFGQEVYISTLKDGLYSHLVQYTTVRDASSALDASFPISYGAPKNILYSPLYSSLQIGKTYTFKIKCESCTKIAVIDGSNWNYLTKSGSVFTGQIKISGSGQVKISTANGNSYSTMYQYQINK